MQRGRGGRGDFFDFGDPFGGFGGFGSHRSLISSFFGKDPFDDPFFTRPFGSSMFGPSMFGPSGSLFGDSPSAGFIEDQPPQQSKSKGPIIQELSEDDEKEDNGNKERSDNSRKLPRASKEPFVQDPDDEAEGRKSKYVQHRSEYNRANRAQPQTQRSSFQSSTVTYGGANGAYYTASTTRRTGGDGVTVEESKEADTTTRTASHRLSRGIHDKLEKRGRNADVKKPPNFKELLGRRLALESVLPPIPGHSVTRKLKSDGKVDAMQMLHNLNEDELPVFEEAWKGNARKHLPGWNQGYDVHGNGSMGGGAGNSGQNGQASSGWKLPSTEVPRVKRG